MEKKTNPNELILLYTSLYIVVIGNIKYQPYLNINYILIVHFTVFKKIIY